MVEGVTVSHIGYLPQQTVVQRDFPAAVFEVVLSGLPEQNRDEAVLLRRGKEKSPAEFRIIGDRESEVPIV